MTTARGALGLALIAAACGCSRSTPSPGATPEAIECQPLAEFCAEAGCPADWIAAQNPETYRARHGHAELRLGRCGAFDAASAAYVDAGTTFYFDAAGALVGADVYGVGLHGCGGDTPPPCYLADKFVANIDPK